MTHRVQRCAAAIGLLAFTFSVATEANAPQSITVGVNRCTITAKAPTLKGTTLTATASVLCTKAGSVLVETGVVELDGTVEDIKVQIKMTPKAVTVAANKAVTVTTASVVCASTETGKEEFATKARVNIAGAVSAYDRTVPKADSFAC